MDQKLNYVTGITIDTIKSANDTIHLNSISHFFFKLSFRQNTKLCFRCTYESENKNKENTILLYIIQQ